MAHYDCSNCGDYGGIAFGMCKSCTPKEWDELNRRRGEAIKEAQDLWDQKNATLIERVAQIDKEMAEARKLGTEAIAFDTLKEIDDRLHEIQMKHDYGYQYMQERKNKS